MSVLSQCKSIIFYWVISAPGHGKEVVDGPNTISKRCMYQLMSNVQLPVSKTFYSRSSEAKQRGHDFVDAFIPVFGN